MKKLNIGIFMDDFYPNINGVVLVIDALATNMCKYANVTIVVPETDSSEGDDEKPYDIYRVNSIHLPLTEYHLGVPKLTLRKTDRDLLAKNFDIIHIHSPFSMGKLGLRIAKKLNIPAIATMHTRFDFEFRKYLKSDHLSKLLIHEIIKVYNKCNACIAINNAMVKVFEDFGYKGKPIIEYNGTELKLIDNPEEKVKKINKMFKLKPDETMLLFVGRINEVKNIFFILDVMKRLKEKGIAYKMFYVGTGPDEEKLKKKIKEYKLDDRVIMTGKITDREILSTLYYRAKLFIFPSLFDASSLVQIEAASQKTPAVFIEGSVTSDTVTNNVNGFTAPNDLEKFTDRIIEILNDEKLYKQVSENAHRDLAKSWETISKETYQIYLDVIDKYKRSNA